jgi:hypothetical protein
LNLITVVQRMKFIVTYICVWTHSQFHALSTAVWRSFKLINSRLRDFSHSSPNLIIMPHLFLLLLFLSYISWNDHILFLLLFMFLLFPLQGKPSLILLWNYPMYVNTGDFLCFLSLCLFFHNNFPYNSR